MRYQMLFPIVACLIVAFGCGGGAQVAPAPEASSPDAPASEDVQPAVAERHDVVYVCNCAHDCACGDVSVKPGDCSCGTELKNAHVVKIEGTESLLCTCSGECECTIDPEDETKCSCGQPLRRVSLEGTGLYFCNCGESCACNHIADGPGECACGMKLITAG